MPPEREGRLTCEIRFAADDAKADAVDVEVLAYNGGILEVGYGREVVDLQGLEHLAKLPFLRDHDRERIAGFADQVDNDKKRLVLKGKLLVGTEEGRAVRELAKAGFPWQASIGWQVLEDEFVPAGQARTVNGQSIPGPFWHDKRCRLKECSVVPLGADQDTNVKAAAAAEEKRKMADATTTPDPVAAERARVKALRAAFPDDRAFADEHEEKGSTLEQAKLAYADRAAAEIKKLRGEKAEAEKALEAAKKAAAPSSTHVPGVRPAGDKTPPPEGGEKTARQRWDEKVREARASGLDREAAVKTAQRENPELHREMLAEVNPGKPEPAYRAGLK